MAGSWRRGEQRRRPLPKWQSNRAKAGTAKKGGHKATWIAYGSALGAIVAALAALAAAFVATAQVNVASQQNNVSEQTELLTLTTNIAQQFAQQQQSLNQGAGTLTGPARAAALSSAQVGISNQLEGDGEAAAVIISKLPSGWVAGAEFVQVGKALQAGNNPVQAIEYYQDAVSAPPHVAGTIADALNNEGSLYYGLGQTRMGHTLMMQAAAVYTDRPGVPQFNADNGIAQSYLDDASYQLRINGCRVAEADLTNAQKALAPLGTGYRTAAVAVAELAAQDSSKYYNRCKLPQILNTPSGG